MKSFLIPAAACFIWLACGKSGPVSPGNPGGTSLTIRSISPTTGPGGTTVIVTGTGFSPAPAQDSLFVNGNYAVLNSVNDSAAVITVPLRAGTGQVTAKVSNSIASGPVFTYQYTESNAAFAGNSDINDVDGQGAAASFGYPTGMAIDDSGNLFVSEAASGRVRTVTPGALVGTYPIQFKPTVDLNAGTNGITISDIVCIAWDASADRLYLGDGSWNIVGGFTSEGNPASTELMPSTPFSGACGVTAGQGNVYVANCIGNNLLIVNGTTGNLVKNLGSSLFNEPTGIALDTGGNAYITNAGGNNILKVSAGGTVSVFAGSGTKGNADGQGTAATFFGPQGIALDAQGNVYVADSYNQRVRMITPDGTVSTFPFQYSYPIGIAAAPDGSTVFVADALGCVIYKITIQ